MIVTLHESDGSAKALNYNGYIRCTVMDYIMYYTVSASVSELLH